MFKDELNETCCGEWRESGSGGPAHCDAEVTHSGCVVGAVPVHLFMFCACGKHVVSDDFTELKGTQNTIVYPISGILFR